MSHNDLDIDFPVGRPTLPSGIVVEVVLTCTACNREGKRNIWVQSLGDEREFICIKCKRRRTMKVRPRLLSYI